MKKIICFLLIAVMVVSMTACGGGSGSSAKADSHGVERYGVVVGERHRLIDESAQPLGMVGTAEVFVVVDAHTVLTYGHGTGIGAGVYV